MNRVEINAGIREYLIVLVVAIREYNFGIEYLYSHDNNFYIKVRLLSSYACFHKQYKS